MMTSLDMHGFSISLYRADEDDRALLARATPLRAWPGVAAFDEVATRPLPDGLKPIAPTPSDDAATRAFLARCCEVLIASEAALNALDAKAGDGDTGSTLAGAARALTGAMDRLPLADHTQLLRAIGQELAQTMGGSSGVLLAIFFAAAGDAASSGHAMRGALLIGLERMQEIGGARVGDRTMIDALRPALEALADGLPAAAAARPPRRRLDRDDGGGPGGPGGLRREGTPARPRRPRRRGRGPPPRTPRVVISTPGRHVRHGPLERISRASETDGGARLTPDRADARADDMPRAATPSNRVRIVATPSSGMDPHPPSRPRPTPPVKPVGAGGPPSREGIVEWMLLGTAGSAGQDGPAGCGDDPEEVPVEERRCAFSTQFIGA